MLALVLKDSSTDLSVYELHSVILLSAMNGASIKHTAMRIM